MKKIHRMTPEIHARVQEQLELLPFVRWDRFCLDDERMPNVFGWIDRPHDDKPDRKDFILLYFDTDGSIHSFMTSSAARSLEIYKILNDGDGRGHNNCRRVEEYFNIGNAIRL